MWSDDETKDLGVIAAHETAVRIANMYDDLERDSPGLGVVVITAMLRASGSDHEEILAAASSTYSEWYGK